MAVVTFNPSPSKGVLSDTTANLSQIMAYMPGDTYFDSTDEFGRVDLFYTHQDSRQVKQLTMKVRTPGVVTGGALWTDGARDGTWSITRLVAYDRDGARNISDSTDLLTDSPVSLV